MTPGAFQSGMALLHEVFPRKELSEAAGGMYLSVCRDLSDEVWYAAITRVVGTSKFFPVPAELLTAANEIASQAHGVAMPETAWEHVHSVARSWGEGALVKHRFDDLTWQALQAIGGIRSVAIAEDGYEIGQKRKEFIAAYDRRRALTVENIRALRLPNADGSPALSDGRIA